MPDYPYMNEGERLAKYRENQINSRNHSPSGTGSKPDMRPGVWNADGVKLDSEATQPTLTTHDSSDRETKLQKTIEKELWALDSEAIRYMSKTNLIRVPMQSRAYAIMQHIKADREAAVLEGRIHSLHWALNDYNMPDTDTANNLRNFIDDLDEELEALKQKEFK